jgi:hypothetical protein
LTRNAKTYHRENMYPSQTGSHATTAPKTKAPPDAIESRDARSNSPPPKLLNTTLRSHLHCGNGSDVPVGGSARASFGIVCQGWSEVNTLVSRTRSTRFFAKSTLHRVVAKRAHSSGVERVPLMPRPPPPPQSQAQRSSLRGDQPQSGHRMRGPEGSRLFS